MGGAVYVFHHPDILFIYEKYKTKYPDIELCNYCKVGKANDCHRRFAGLSTSLICDICPDVFIYPSDDNNYTSRGLYFIEKVIHVVLDGVRIRPNREYFEIVKIDSFISDIQDYFRNIGMAIRTTKNPSDLQQVYDFGLDDSDIMDVNIDECQATLEHRGFVVQRPNHGLNPQPHQIDILNKLRAWYSSAATSGKLILPPGIGKSYITGFLLRELPATTKVLVLVPLLSIMDDFNRALEKCGVKCKYKVLVNNTARESKLPACDICIYDEAHHVCSNQNAKLLSITATKKLFLTATEKIYEENDEILDMNKPVFGDYIYKMSMIEAIKKRLLIDYKIFLADWSLGLENMVAQLKKDYLRKKIIMFFNTVENAMQICGKLNELKFPAACITGDTKQEERRVIIDKFTAAPFHILCNVTCISEGVNIPCIDTVMFMDTRKSNIGVIQNIGRGLRKAADKDFCMVIVPEQMMTLKFICNLAKYDDRVVNIKQMVIRRPDARKSRMKEYSIEGVVELVEKYSTIEEKENETDLFVKKLKAMDIYSESEYRIKMTGKYTDEFPACPDIKYNGFDWEILLACPNPYTYEQCIEVVLDLSKRYTQELQKISNKHEKLICMFKKDNRLNPNMFNEMRADQRLPMIYINSLARRAAK